MAQPAGGDLVARSEAARRLGGISVATVRRLVLAGDLDERRISPGSPRITTASIQRLIERGTRPGYQKAMSA